MAWLEQNNNIENIEQTTESLNKEINTKITKIKEIAWDNESVQKLTEVSNKLRDNKDALKIINEWLNKISDNISIIKQTGEEQIKKIFDSLKHEIELSETTIPNIDDQINNL